MESTHSLFPQQILRQHTIHCLPRDLREERGREGWREGGKYIGRKGRNREEGGDIHDTALLTLEPSNVSKAVSYIYMYIPSLLSISPLPSFSTTARYCTGCHGK